MSYRVLLLEEAAKDIEAIYRFIRKSGNKKAAMDMVINIRKACESLSENPKRGHIPDELSQIGQFEYRQIIAKKYRIIYQLAKPDIFIFGIIHGNRNIGIDVSDSCKVNDPGFCKVEFYPFLPKGLLGNSQMFSEIE